MAAALAFISCIWAGVYLCVHDFPVLGGWMCLLSVLATWGFERGKK